MTMLQLQELVPALLLFMIQAFKPAQHVIIHAQLAPTSVPQLVQGVQALDQIDKIRVLLTIHVLATSDSMIQEYKPVLLVMPHATHVADHLPIIV